MTDTPKTIRVEKAYWNSVYRAAKGVLPAKYSDADVKRFTDLFVQETHAYTRILRRYFGYQARDIAVMLQTHPEKSQNEKMFKTYMQEDIKHMFGFWGRVFQNEFPKNDMILQHHLRIGQKALARRNESELVRDVKRSVEKKSAQKKTKGEKEEYILIREADFLRNMFKEEAPHTKEWAGLHQRAKNVRARIVRVRNRKQGRLY